MISNDEAVKLKLISKRNLRKKERKGAQDRKLIDRPCESNIY